MAPKRARPLSTPLQADRRGWALLGEHGGVESDVDGLFILGRAGGGQRFDARAGERAVFVAHEHGAIHEVEERGCRAGEGDGGAGGPDAMERAAGAERQGLGQGAFFAPRQSLVERLEVVRPGTMSILLHTRGRDELGVPASDEGRCEGLRVSIVAIPLSRISLTSRSCKVWLARSTRPLACGVSAWMSSIRSRSATRPNSVLPSPLAASLALLRNIPCRSE